MYLKKYQLGRFVRLSLGIIGIIDHNYRKKFTAY